MDGRQLATQTWSSEKSGRGAHLSVMDVEVVFEMRLGLLSKRKVGGVGGEWRTWD